MNNIYFAVQRWRKWFVVAGIALTGALSWIAMGQSTPPVILPVLLQADPLTVAAAVDKPTMTIALGASFTTVGAQYVDAAASKSTAFVPVPGNLQGVSQSSIDASYSNGTEYLGYFDAESCYAYIDAPTAADGMPQGADPGSYKRFKRVASATDRTCTTANGNDGFSGNYLNWVSMSSMDILRLALTGGHRAIDNSNLTVLERAMLPYTDPIPMWNSNEFPAKRLYQTGIPGKPYFGAVPAGMISAARGAESIWVANVYNKIYFGTQYGGAHPETSLRHNLGSHRKVSDVVSGAGSYTIGKIACTKPIGPCLVNAGETAVVTSGSNNSALRVYVQGPATIKCNNTAANKSVTNLELNDSFFLRPSAYSCAKYAYIQASDDNWNPVASGAELLNSDGFFYARVQVCDKDDNSTLLENRSWSLCKQYPAGNYKPVGTLQKYSEKLRVAVLDYANDPSANSNTSYSQYGGVLRVPMRYIGPTTYTSSGSSIGSVSVNPLAEWSASTGVFAVNPDNNSEFGTSGVINYINKLGQRGAIPGKYRYKDPVGELHYEALRYLQGLQPRDLSIQGLLDSNSTNRATAYNGFPAYTSWFDPFANGSTLSNYACQKNSIFSVGDRVGADSNRLPSASAADNIPNIVDWRDVVKSFENNQTLPYVDSQGVTRSTTTNLQGTNNLVPGLTDSSQILGSAYWARSQDIRGASWTNSHYNAVNGAWSSTPTESTTDKKRPGMRVKTYAFDPNQYGSMDSYAYRSTQSQMFMAAKYGGYETNPANLEGGPYNVWGNPFKQSGDATVDDVGTETAAMGVERNYIWATAETGRAGDPKTYYQSGSNVLAVLSAFDSIFNQVVTSASSIAGVGLQSTQISSAGTTMYRASYDTGDWSGDVVAIPVTEDDHGGLTLGETSWSAAAQLLALTDPVTSRKIFVGNSGASSSQTASAFTTAAVSDTVKDHLNVSPTGSTDNLWSERLQYLRGDASNYGLFRERTQLMGDVINSGISYSGAPASGISSSSSYQTFYTAYKTRTAAVFAGANDGMLHAFKAETGKELFAYIPSWVVPRLSALTGPDYVSTNHTSFVDATSVVAEAELASGWKTVLVSGSGNGGRGVFALDVTNPEQQFVAANVLWEFTNADDADLGNVVGVPQILKLRTTDAGSGTAEYKWFAVFGNGVNSYVADSAGIFSETGNPALFFLDLSKAAGQSWTLNTNYFKVSLPTAGATINATHAAGLINFTPVLDSSLAVSKIYMGDLQGRFWKLDFSTYGSSNWNLSKLSGFAKTSGGSSTAIPMFISNDADGAIQPITAPPSVVSGEQIGSYKVVFGTGKYLEASDTISVAVQSQYMLYDDGTGATDGASDSSAITSRLYLKQGLADEDTGLVSIADFVLGLATEVTDDVKSGWYYDFSESGERQVSSGTLLGSRYISATIQPASSGCNSVDDASGRSYEVEIDSGDGVIVNSTVGMLGAPVVLNSTDLTEYSVTDSTGRKRKTMVSHVVYQGNDGFSTRASAAAAIDSRCPATAPAGSLCTVVAAGRLSWRQVNNYHQLKATDW